MEEACDSCAKAVILLMSSIVAFKVQKWIDGSDFTLGGVTG